MKNKLRWMLKAAIRLRGRYLRSPVGMAYPGARPRSMAYYVGGGIGDAVMAYPALCLLKHSFPDASLDVYVPAKTFEVLAKVLEQFEPRAMTRALPFVPSARRRFDIAFSNTVAAFYLAIESRAFLSARHSYGFHYPDEEPHTRLYDATLPLDDTMHDIDQNCLLVAKALNIQFDISQVGYQQAERAGIAPDAAVVMHPGVESGYDYKLWPLWRYNDIITRLVERGHTVKVLLGPSETHMRSSFEESDPVRLLVNPSADVLVGEIRSARLFVGNDSGPAHIAAFYGVPGITLIGPVDPGRTEPRGKHSITIHNDIDCSPCHFGKQQCKDNKCMKSITVEQVWREIERLI